MPNLKKRYILKEIENSLLDNYVIIIDGPNGLNKESLALEATKENYLTIDFKNEELRELALTNPKAFLRSLPPYIILKDLYLVPAIIKELSDLVYELRIKHNGFLKNSFIIIQDFDTTQLGLKNEISKFINKNFHITPTYAAEIIPYGDINFLNNLFQKKYFPKVIENNYDLRQLMTKCTFPEILRNKKLDKNQYLRNLIGFAAKIFSNKSIEADNLQKIIEILSSNIGKLYSENILPKDSNITEMQFFDLTKKLTSTGLYIPIEQWSPNHDKAQQKIIHLIDTNLAIFARKETTINDANFDILYKNFIISEIYKQTKTYGNYKLYHFQLYKECPMDYIVENLLNNNIVSINIETSPHIKEETIGKIKRFRNHCSSFLKRNIIIYPGDKVIKFEADIIAMPIAALWYSGGT